MCIYTEKINNWIFSFAKIIKRRNHWNIWNITSTSICIAVHIMFQLELIYFERRTYDFMLDIHKVIHNVFVKAISS